MADPLTAPPLQGSGVVPPYYTYVSEMMLQATRVASVKTIFPLFILRFPNVAILSTATVQEVTALIAPLGNSVARGSRFVEGAVMMVDSFSGQVPNNYSDLVSLPGVGDYTARAILSIGFGQQMTLPPTETNVQRVISRLLNLAPLVPAWDRNQQVATLLQNAIPMDRPGDFNQSIMELGQVLCPSGVPNCNVCPLKYLCKYNATQL